MEQYWIVKDWQIQQLKRRWLCHHFLWLAQKKGPATFHIHSEWMNKECRGVRIEISHRDILLTFLDRPYLSTLSPVNMMMNNISWRASECASPGESPGSLCLLPMSSSFLCTTLSWEWGWRGAGDRRESVVDNHYSSTHTSLRNTPVREPPPPLQPP